VSVVAN